MSMQFNKKNQLLYFTVLFSAVIFIVVMYSKLNSKNDRINQLTTENLLLQSKFERIVVRYDSVMTSNEMSPLDDPELKTDAINSRNNVTNIEVENTTKSDFELKNKVADLKKEIKKNTQELRELESHIKENKTNLTNTKTLNSNSKIESSDLTINNISARGVRIVTNANSRNKEKKIQQLRVCFSIDENEFTLPGNKEIYIQVLNPRNQIITNEHNYLVKDNLKFKYTAVIDADFKNTDLDVCSYVDLDTTMVYKGKYLINIYHNFKKISSTYFDYE